jgi:hypothetical protein
MRISTQSEACEEAVAAALPPSLPEERKKERIRSMSKAKAEDIATAMMIVLVPIIIFEALFHSASKPLWYDEVLTAYISHQTRVSEMWNLLTHGVDGHPLGFYLVEHMMVGLGGNERITLRLPSIAAFLCVMMCMYVFIQRRVGSLIAVVSVSALLITNLYNPFAFEARSYGLMVACIAVALLAYERADSWIWAVIFALSLAAASSFHFYAALAFFPFGLAELTDFATEHRIRKQVWLGFLAGMSPYLLFWPILHEQRLLYGAHFWAVPTFWNLGRSFGELLRLTPSFSFAIFAAALFYLIQIIYTGNFRVREKGALGSGFSVPDVALTFGFFTIPIVTFVVAKIGHGGLSGRYITAMNLGISLVLSLFLSRLKNSAIVTTGLFVLCMFAFQEGALWRYVLRPHENIDPMHVPSQMANDLNVPVVIPDGLIYLPLWYRANGELKSHLFFLANPQEEYSVGGSDTTTLLLMTMKDFAPIHVRTFSEFAQSHRRFLLFSNGDTDDFWPRWLAQRGYSLRAITVGPPNRSLMEDTPDLPKEILFFVDLDERM